MRTSTTCLGLAAALTLTLSLAGCGGGEATPSVASLPSAATVTSSGASAPAGGASSTSTSTPMSADAEDQRPLERPDMDQAEIDRLDNAYLQCLAKNGFSKNTLVAQMKQGTKTMDDFNAAEASAETACASVDPEAWWERAQRKDPDWEDELHAWVKCVNDHGIRAEEDNGEFAFSVAPPTDSQGTKIVNDCELKAIPKV